MTMPKFNELFSQVLTALEDGEPHKHRDVLRAVADGLGLNDDERAETMNGGGNRAENRAYWASTYLFQSGATERPRRGYLQITQFGRALLHKYPQGLPLAELEETKGLQDWYARTVAQKDAKKTRGKHSGSDEQTDEGQTPDEVIDNAYSELRAARAVEIIDLLHGEPPEFLEHAVLKVLRSLDYGSSMDDLQHLGQSGDGGVDGVINQDRLGLDQIYVQAKRHDPASTIGRPEVQKFAGAVVGKKASRGIYIATSRFSKEARDYAKDLKDPRLILVDGKELADLMLENEIGVTVQKTFKVYAIDENFFES
jgi:restriction system protein